MKWREGKCNGASGVEGKRKIERKMDLTAQRRRKMDKVERRKTDSV